MNNPHDIYFPKGSDYLRSFTYQDSTGTSVSLAGITLRMQLRRRPEDTNPIIELSSAGSGITKPTSSVFVVTLSASQLAALPTNVAVYKIDLIRSDSSVITLMEGKFWFKTLPSETAETSVFTAPNTVVTIRDTYTIPVVGASLTQTNVATYGDAVAAGTGAVSRMISVMADSTNDNKTSLYFWNGVTLTWIPTEIPTGN